MKKIFILGIVFFIALVSAAIYQEPWIQNQLGDQHNLTDMDWISANTLNGTTITGTFTGEVTGSMNWTKLKNYPSACPGSSAITLLNDSVTCSDLWVDTAGDNMTGNLNVTGDIIVSGEINATNINLDKYGVSAYLNATATTTTTLADTWYPINGTFINEIMEGFYLNITDPLDPSIVYNGTETQYFDIDWAASVATDAAATTVHIGARNGATPDGWEMATLCKTAGEEYFIGGTMSIELSQGERVQLVIQSDDAGDVISVIHFTTKIRESFA